MPDDVMVDKCEIIGNCLRRIREEYSGRSEHLRKNITKQDSILLNLERACQAAIDLAMRVIRLKGLGIPKESREAFRIMEQAGYLDPALSDSMQRMVGLRNVAIHAYQDLDLDVVEKVIAGQLGDFERLVQIGLGI